MICGAQKGGTSSLFAWLARHPSVRPARVKEVHFFDKKYRLGEAAYRAEFPLRWSLGRGRVVRDGRPRALTGEATPSYLAHPVVPERMAKMIPRAKLLFLLRDPVDRAFSHYRMSVRRGFEALSFEEALDAEPERMEGESERLRGDPDYFSHALKNHSYAFRGDYASQLERFLVHFPREQLLVLSSEALFEDPDTTWREVLRFLDLPEAPLVDRVAENVGGESVAMDDAVRERLSARFVESNQRLFTLLGRRFPWSRPTSHEPTRAAGESPR